MRIHLVQLDIAWEDAAANHRAVRAMLASPDVRSGGLIVLPEMFDSGFSLDIDKTADQRGDSLRFLAATAKETSCWVVGGITVLAPGHPGKALNRCIAAAPTGDIITHYDKAHPFTFGREGEKFIGGESVATFRWGGGGAGENGGESMTVCPVICYDLRFPELFRRGLAEGAEAFTVIANWPVGRAEHWRALLIARAIENQALVIGVNRVGADPHLRYAGGSMVVGPRGTILAEAGAGAGLTTTDADPGEVRRWREAFPAWKDGKSWLWPRGVDPPGGGSCGSHA